MATSHKYKKRTSWEREEMAADIAAVSEKKMGYLKATTLLNIPRSPLSWVVTDRDFPIDAIKNKVIGRRPILGQEIENLVMEDVSPIENSSDDVAMRDETAVCFFCNGKYSDDKSGEEWVLCLMCEFTVLVVAMNLV
ncbi:hypothetical protein HHI36_006629 [Cryptolaemus montrouzieri]|uniref:Uncharacterized protein n=1 Tax=Cryptolaemus montrouzieri TaxID=559131 RepID=A0ABD2NXN2_9CUCU